MGKKLDHISADMIEFIVRQKVFFVGTAASEGRVNISPKGAETLKVVTPNRVLWLNLTGSGNETAAHLLKNNRMTIMFCAFEGKPLILRLYGQAEIYHNRHSEFQHYASYFPEYIGARQIIEMDVDLVQTSCGFGVPLMDFVEERTALNSWAKKQGKERIKNYWETKNLSSIDGFDTNILSD